MPLQQGESERVLFNEFTKFCLWTIIFVYKTLYALDMPQVTLQVNGGLFINAHAKLYLLFHKCGENETIPQHFYREHQIAVKAMTTTNANFFFFRFLSMNTVLFVLSFTDLNVYDWWYHGKLQFSHKTLWITIKPRSNSAVGWTPSER